MDDDLDALLDSALDTMTAQDTALEQERLAQEAAAQSLLNEAVSASAAAGGDGAPLGGMDADMLQALGGLMAILQKGPDAMENASDEEMAAITGQLQSTLDKLKSHPDLKAEDAGQLGDMTRMMEQLSALEKGQAEGPAGEPPMSEEAFNARRDELTAMLEKMGAPGGLMGGAGGGGPDLPPFPFGDMTPSAAAAAVAAANAAGVPVPPIAANPTAPPSGSGADEAALSEEEACRQVFEMTLGILQEKEIEQPFAKLRAAYGPWLAANAAALPDEERVRYEQQHRVAGEMCDFFEKERISEVLKEGGEASAARRAEVLERFGTLMAELHSYGEVPPTLFPELAEEGPSA